MSWNLERVGGTATRHRPGDGRARVRKIFSLPPSSTQAMPSVRRSGGCWAHPATRSWVCISHQSCWPFSCSPHWLPRSWNAQYRLLAQAETPPPVAKSQAPRHNADTGSACGRSASASSSMTIGDSLAAAGRSGDPDGRPRSPPASAVAVGSLRRWLSTLRCSTGCWRLTRRCAEVERDLGCAPQRLGGDTCQIATEGFGSRLLALQDPDGQWAGGAYFPGDFDFQGPEAADDAGRRGPRRPGH